MITLLETCKPGADVIGAARISKTKWIVAYHYNGEYMTHIYNQEDNACFIGHYFGVKDYDNHDAVERAACLADFAKRVMSYQPEREAVA